MRSLSVAALLLLALPGYSDDKPAPLFPDQGGIKDARLGPPKDLNGYFPFAVPASKPAWDDRAASVRTGPAETELIRMFFWPRSHAR